MPDTTGKTVYIMLKEGRPELGDQMAAARAWGADVDRPNAGVFKDDVRGVRSTKPEKILVDREYLFRDLKHAAKDEQIFFHTPLCIGLSQSDAEAAVRTVWDRGCLVYVHSSGEAGSLLYRKGDDLTGLLEQFQRDYNANAMRLSRARGKSRPKK